MLVQRSHFQLKNLMIMLTNGEQKNQTFDSRETRVSHASISAQRFFRTSNYNIFQWGKKTPVLQSKS